MSLYSPDLNTSKNNHAWPLSGIAASLITRPYMNNAEYLLIIIRNAVIRNINR